MISLNTKSRKLKNIVLFCCTIIISLSLSGCTLFGKSEDDNVEKKAVISNDNQLRHYNRASRKLSANKYEDALEIYNEFLVKYPFGNLSERASLERIFILNKIGAVEDASIAVERFINQHPLHPNIDYAYYMRGVVLFEKKRIGFFKRLSGAKELLRNKNNFQQSHEAFANLVEDFPDSQYVPDARKRMTFLRNNMAIYEFKIAKFYAERNAHIGAIKRAEFIVANYDQAPAVIDALNLMIISYEKIGLNDKASETKALLESNYANVEGFNGSSRKQSKSWLRAPKLPNLNPFKKNSNKS